MNRYIVWHDKIPSYGMGIVQGFPNFPDSERYEKVAEVECEGLEDAFYLTNHVHRSWTTNANVTVLGDGRHRSTSVGDVIVDMGTGKAWRCDMVGWTEIIRKLQ